VLLFDGAMRMKNNLQQFPVKYYSGVGIGCWIMIDREKYFWHNSRQSKDKLRSDYTGMSGYVG
jgi:hypothetical protein